MKAAAMIAALFAINTAYNGTVDHALKPGAAEPTAPAPVSVSQLPLLFIVDGIRYAGDQVPLLSADLVASVRVVKGHRALEQYGPDASYGVVVITTKLAARRS